MHSITCARKEASCALARLPGTLVSRHPLPVVRSPRLCRGLRGHIGHLPIRSRGTFCGSIAHADPASEWCLLAATLDAELVIVSRRGQRSVRPNEYFVGALSTILEPDELLTEIRLPLLGEDWRTGFAEFSRRAGDFAL